MKKSVIYGLKIDRTTARKAAFRLAECASYGKVRTVFTPNFEILTKARRDAELIRLLQKADVLLPDGVGVSLLCKIKKEPPCGRAAGIDTAYLLMRHAARRGLRVFLLGAEVGIAKEAKRRLCREIPKLCVCGTYHGYFDKSQGSDENTAVLEKIRQARPDILLVCFGFPTQERWISENRSSLPSVKIFMGLGGSLDVWSGKKRRAPVVMRACGLEWLWRLTFLFEKRKVSKRKTE